MASIQTNFNKGTVEKSWLAFKPTLSKDTDLGHSNPFPTKMLTKTTVKLRQMIINKKRKKKKKKNEIARESGGK